jgi:hypothetical protein
MAIPCSAKGYGNGSTARNVFRLTFSQALSSPPLYKMWDSASVFPATGALVTTANTVFAGTAGNGNIPMISLVDTSSGSPAGSWKPGSATAGSANPNRMMGSTNYVTATATPGAAGSITWNEVLELPSDATTSSSMGVDLEITYQYTGTTPVLTWAVNDDGAGGTEGAPVWTTLTPGTHGLRHTKAGTVSGGPYYLDIPPAGTIDSAMGWVTT